MSLPPIEGGINNQNLPTTVAGTLRYALKLYDAINDGSPMDPNYQPCVSLTLTLFLRLWSHVVNEGIFRKGESLREMSDLNLELLPVPFYLGRLSEKRMVNNAASSGNNNGEEAVVDARQLQQQKGAVEQQQERQIQERISRSNSRGQSLLACNDFLFKFLAVCVEVKLCTEKDVATKPFASAIDRTTRLDISKKRFALEDEVKELENKVRFARERAKRNARIMREDEKQERVRESRREAEDAEHNGENDNAVVQQERRDELEEEFIENLLTDDDDYQATRRDRHIKTAEWAIYESYSLLQGNARELEILGSLSDNEKKKAIEDFQRNLNASTARIPGLSSASASSSSSMYNFVAEQEAKRKNGTDPMTNKVEEKNYTVLPDGSVVPFGSVTSASATAREQIRDQAFMNRNNPTMTLGEYADMEMEYMRKMQAKEAQGKLEHEEENERLGEDGVEERERKKDSAWDDWKDDNPSVGQTSKGNYA